MPTHVSIRKEEVLGQIKELRKKLQDGTITDDEKATLAELEAEAREDGDDEAKMIDDIAEKLASATMEKLDSKNKANEVKETVPQVKVVSPRMIVDKTFGEISVDKAATTMVKIQGREDKVNQEVSLKTVHYLKALVQSDQQKLQLLVEGTAARGGYLVPDDFANIIVEDLRDQSVMRQLGTVITTDSDTLHLPSLASRPKAAWRSEGAVKSTSTVDFGENIFTPYSLASIVGLSQELADDASLGVNGSIVNYIAQAMVQGLNEKEEAAFWNGSGSGQPTGFTTYTIPGVTTAGTDSAKADAMIRAYFQLPQAYRRRASWVANGSTWAKLHTVKDSQGNYLMGSLAGLATESIKGRPVFEQNDIADGVVYFGDFSYYYIVDNNGISTRISDEATVAGQSAFERNLVFVRVEKRVDAELTLTSPFRRVTGI
jgi:HK97 family phage major capsid protein